MYIRKHSPDFSRSKGAIRSFQQTSQLSCLPSSSMAASGSRQCFSRAARPCRSVPAGTPSERRCCRRPAPLCAARGRHAGAERALVATRSSSKRSRSATPKRQQPPPLSCLMACSCSVQWQEARCASRRLRCTRRRVCAARWCSSAHFARRVPPGRASPVHSAAG